MPFNLQNLFDSVGNMTNDPQFQMGLGLMGAASPIKNAPMMAAFQALQGMKKAQTDAAFKKAETEARTQQVDVYKQQVLAQQQKLKMLSGQQAMVQNIMPGILQAAGINQGQPTGAAPVIPAPQQSMPQLDQSGPMNVGDQGSAIPSPVAPQPNMTAAALPRLNAIVNPQGAAPYNPYATGNPQMQIQPPQMPMTPQQARKPLATDADAQKIYHDEYVRAIANFNNAPDQASKMRAQNDLQGLQREMQRFGIPFPGMPTDQGQQQQAAIPPAQQTPAPQPMAQQPGFPMPGNDPSRGIKIAAGAVQTLGSSPAAGLVTMADALAPKSYQPGTFVQGADGKITQVPNPITPYQQQELQGQAQTRSQAERRLTFEQQTALQQMDIRDQGQRQKLAKDTGMVGDTIAKSDNSITKINELLNAPGLNNITGRYAGLPPAVRRVIDPQGMDAQAALESIKSQVLLGQLMSMKELSANGSSGFGQLNENEGQAIRSSLASLDASQTTESLKKNLTDIRNVIQNARERTSRVYRDTWGEKAMNVEPQKQNAAPITLDEYLKKMGK